MRICFLSVENSLTVEADGTNADLFVFPFSALGEVDFEAEIGGKSEKLRQVASLSKRLNAAVMCGCYTLIKGVRHKSVAVADRGRIIGIADMINSIGGKKVRPGAGLKLFDISAGKIGVAVAEDIFFHDVVESLSACGCLAVVCPFDFITNHTVITVARAYSFVCGVHICVCAGNYSFASSPSGNIAFATPQSGFVYEFSSAGEYRLIERKTRGFFGL